MAAQRDSIIAIATLVRFRNPFCGPTPSQATARSHATMKIFRYLIAFNHSPKVLAPVENGEEAAIMEAEGRPNTAGLINRLDHAMLTALLPQDRVDEMVEFALPGRDERLRMLTQYFTMYIEDPEQKATAIQFPDVDTAVLETIADQTEGFSGRSIAKLAIAWQAAAYGEGDATLTPAMMDSILQVFLTQASQRSVWEKAEE